MKLRHVCTTHLLGWCLTTKNDLPATLKKFGIIKYRVTLDLRKVHTGGGHGDWDEATWLGYGSAHREMVEDGLRMLGRSAKIRRVVEWGSGGGANMFAISPVAEKYFGVDISASNLAECERQAESVDLKNVEPVHVPVDRPEAVLDQILEGRDANPVDLQKV